MKIVPGWLAVIFAMALMALAVGGGWFFRGQERQARTDVEEDLETIASLKVHQIALWRLERLGDAAVLMESPFVRAAVDRYMANPHVDLAEPILTVFHSFLKHCRFVDVLLVDTRGQLQLSLTGRTAQIDEVIEQYMATAFRERRAVLTCMYADSGELPPRISAVAPIFEGGGEMVEPIGAIILQCDARQFLYPLIQSWPTPSRSAETMLVRRDGDEVLFLNDLRHRADTSLKLRIPLSNQDNPAVAAVLGKAGVMEGKDYRGIEVLAVWKAVPDTNWFMVAKIDKAEALKEWRSRSFLILALMLGFVTVLAAGVGMVFLYYAKARYRTLFQAEAALRESEELSYRTTLMSIGDAVIVTNNEGMVRLLNPVAETLTGWQREEAHGRPVGEVFHIINEDTRDPVEDPLASILREGVRVGLVNHGLLVSRDGREFPIANSGAPVRDETGEVKGVVLVFRDLTSERSAERERRQRDESYRLLVRNIPGVVFKGYADGGVEFFDDKITAVTGYPMEDFTSEKMKWTNLIHPEDLALAKRVFLQALREERGYVREYRVRRPDAGYAWVQERSQIVSHEDGRIDYISGVIFDVTERKRSEVEKDELEAQYRQAQKMEAVGRLAGGVAHDFNNMLSVILGYTELTIAGLKPFDPIFEHLKAVQSAANRSADLIRQLLAFSRKQTIAPQVLDLNEQTKAMERLLTRIIGEDIVPAFRLSEGLWPVYMDPAQVDQIVANLAVNSRDAMPKGGSLTVETANITQDEDYCEKHLDFRPGDFVMLAVSDTGCGIDKETLEHVFEPFFTTKPEGKGTGLGLATVYGIVKQNNGFVNIYSEPGQGTTVKIYIPRYFGRETQEKAPIVDGEPTGGWETILLVEDESPMRHLARTMLARLGYLVLDAPGPGEAIVLCEKHSGEIHLLLTDVVMPNMNGKELERRIRAMKPGIRTLFMSGYTANAIAHLGVLEKGAHFLEKPFSMDLLARKVREALSVSS